jgi:hypothetical protein
MGIEFHHADLQPVTLKDADGQPHTFHVQSRLAPTGLVVEAFEVEESNRNWTCLSGSGAGITPPAGSSPSRGSRASPPHEGRPRPRSTEG